MEKTIYTIMADIQARLKAPKGQFNSFGKYKYRSLEDIQEALKPLLAEHGVFVNVQDEIVQVGDRHYVKATATLCNGKEAISATAFAREPADKKGMDESQITGATSSYARKYAMNGLFAIDDTQDADATNTHGKDVPPAQARPSAATATVATPATQEQIDEIQSLLMKSGITENKARLSAFGKRYLGGTSDMSKLTESGYADARERLEAEIAKAGA